MNPGTRLDHYVLVDKIGEGGMGVVWRARDTSLDRDVAVKVLPASFTADAGRLARFEREAKVVAALSHPNIVAIYGFGTAGGVTYAAMELLEGRSLREHLQEGPLPLRKAVDVARQIAVGLDAAHARGIVHRDLKPDNVFLTSDGRARILDFGLANTGVADSAGGASDSGVRTRLTDPGTVVGTAGYMAPEQARGVETGPPADIFALGVMLHEMLSGAPPFQRETTAETLTAILREEPPELRVGSSPAPAPLARLVRRCLEKQPGERFRSAGDLAFALESAVADSASSQPAMPAAPERPARATAAGRLVATTALAAIVAFAAGWWLRPIPPAYEPPQVRELTFTGTDSQPDVSPDNRLIAFTSVRNGTSQIWLRQLDGGGEQPLTEGSDWRPRFSPDGQSVAFIRADGDTYSAYRVPVVGGQPRKLIENVREVAWSPDDRYLAFVRAARRTPSAGDRASLGLLDLQSAQEQIVLTFDRWEMYGLRWSPDSTRIATTRASSQGGTGSWRLVVFDLATGAADVIDIGNSSLISSPAWAGNGALIYAKSTSTVGSSPVPNVFMRYDLQTRQERPLLWEPYLFPFRGSFTETTRINLLGEDRLVFDTFRQMQSLRELDRSAGSIRAIKEGVSVDRQPAYSRDGRRLLFTSNRSGNVDLFAYEFETDQLLQLTDHPASDWDGGYTPDGRSILWSSDRSGNLEIWMADADGSNPRQVTADGVDAENPTMTADGQWIVYSSGNPANPAINKIRPDGSDVTVLVPGVQTNPEVSHDGRYALFATNDESRLVGSLSVVDVESGALVDFRIAIPWGPESPNITYGRGRWMPGDTAVAYIGLDDDGRAVVWIQDFVPGQDTTATRRKLESGGDAGFIESFGISPDGNRFALAMIRDVFNLKLAENLEPLR